MSLDYIRGMYGVPAKRGVRVRLGNGFNADLDGRVGVITGSYEQYLRLKIDGVNTKGMRFHPTWEITYLTR